MSFVSYFLYLAAVNLVYIVTLVSVVVTQCWFFLITHSRESLCYEIIGVDSEGTNVRPARRPGSFSRSQKARLRLPLSPHPPTSFSRPYLFELLRPPPPAILKNPRSDHKQISSTYISRTVIDIHTHTQTNTPRQGGRERFGREDVGKRGKGQAK